MALGTDADDFRDEYIVGILTRIWHDSGFPIVIEWGGPYKITQGIIYAHSIEYVRDGLWWIRAPPHEAEQLLMFCQSFSLVL
jgi:hypothetical protein